MFDSAPIIQKLNFWGNKQVFWVNQQPCKGNVVSLSFSQRISNFVITAVSTVISQTSLWILQKYTALHYHHRGQLCFRCCQVTLVIWRSTALSLFLRCSSARYWIPKLQPSSMYECGHLAIFFNVLITPQLTTSTSLWTQVKHTYNLVYDRTRLLCQRCGNTRTFPGQKHFRKENLQHSRQINVKEASIYLF